jgi:hypothetical protein
MTPTSELSVESDGAPRLFDGANAMVNVVFGEIKMEATRPYLLE